MDKKNSTGNEHRSVNIGSYTFTITTLRGEGLNPLRRKYRHLFAYDSATGELVCRVADYESGNDNGVIQIPRSIQVEGLRFFTRCPRTDDISDYDNAIYNGRFTASDWDKLKESEHKYEDTIRLSNVKETERIILKPSITDDWHKFDYDDINWGEVRKLKSVDYYAPGSIEPEHQWRVVRIYGMKFLIDFVGYTAQLLNDDYYGNIIIPGRIIYKGEDYAVTSLNKHCFVGSHVSHVAIPSTIHRLPDFAYSHEAFTVSIPPNIVSCLPEMIFEYSKVKRITVPKSVQQIQDRCFNRCEELEEVVLPDSINYIGDVCFTGCRKLKTITIPKRVTYLGNICLWYCDSLEEIRCMVKVPPVPQAPKYGVMAWSEDFDENKDDYLTFFKFHDPSAFDRIRLYVPKASVEAYKSSKYWPFTNIIGI